MDLTKQALLLALETMYDESMVSQLYFGIDFKAAVYLPILLPVIMPLLGLLKQYVQYRKIKSALGLGTKRDEL